MRRSPRFANNRVGYQEHGNAMLSQEEMSSRHKRLIAFAILEERKEDRKHESEAGPEWREPELKEVKNLHQYKMFGKIEKIKNLSDSQVPPFRIVYKTKFSAIGAF